MYVGIGIVRPFLCIFNLSCFHLSGWIFPKTLNIKVLQNKNKSSSRSFLCWALCFLKMISGQIIIFHQPGFPWNNGISLPQLHFGVRSCEVAIIWPDDMLLICQPCQSDETHPSPQLGWFKPKNIACSTTVPHVKTATCDNFHNFSK